ncbi:MAG: 50S ribosomal protein L10 [Candidatus Pacearchaeota archaeon]|nr:50S ribosomal protein L10 [Candidatus Pacearchaeota archaeon]
MTNKKTVENIPQRKTKTVQELADFIKNKKTVLIASIKNLPASQFQEISKKLRGKAVVKVPKKNLIFRAIDESGNKDAVKLKDVIEDSVAILFSDMDSYDLAGELLKSKTASKAKAGQEAPFDIEVEPGPTDLVPGPAISELGALGIQIQIEKGKIHIKEAKVIAKEGSKISQGAADIMAKLDIKPFSVGFIPMSGFDVKAGTIYLDIKIDREKTVEDLKEAYGRALPFAVEIGYMCNETARIMVQRAAAHEKRLIRVISGEPEEEVVEAPKEEVKEVKKEEEKAPAAAGLGALFG